jgi:predicted RNase H-like HicB family nuclease
MQDYRYTVIFEQDESGIWLAHVPALNGITTEGDSLDEAKQMVREAIIGYIESLQMRNQPVPTEDEWANPIYEQLAVAV